MITTQCLGFKIYLNIASPSPVNLDSSVKEKAEGPGPKPSAVGVLSGEGQLSLPSSGGSMVSGEVVAAPHSKRDLGGHRGQWFLRILQVEF